MDAIKTYLDNVFAAFQQTQRVLALKHEMLAGMEEKYQILKQEGKSEHEAVGSVIANFGSIDEIAAELGIAQNKIGSDDGISVSREEAFDFLALSRKCGIWIGVGVLMILCGVSALLISSSVISLHEGGFADSGGGVLLLFIFIAAAVVIFIVNGVKYNSLYERYTGNIIFLDAPARAEIEQQNVRFMPRFAAIIAAGVALILIITGVLAVIYPALSFYGDAWPIALFLFVIGFSVTLFITAGMSKTAFDLLLGKGDQLYLTRNIKGAERIIATAASVFWPAIVAVYLLWSFIGDAWGISWIIWPVAGILFGAFSGGVSTWHATKGK